MRDLLTKLLSKDRGNRLGTNGIEDIFNHPYFSDIIWSDVSELKYEPPFLPYLYQFQTSLDNFEKRKGENKLFHTYKRLFSRNN